MDTAKFLEIHVKKIGLTLPEALQRIAQSSYYKTKWLAPDPNKVRNGPKKRHAKAWWYIKYIKQLPCCVCGSSKRVDAIKIENGGVVKFGSDYRAIPVCKSCQENSTAMSYLVCSIAESTRTRCMNLYLRCREGT